MTDSTINKVGQILKGALSITEKPIFYDKQKMENEEAPTENPDSDVRLSHSNPELQSKYDLNLIPNALNASQPAKLPQTNTIDDGSEKQRLTEKALTPIGQQDINFVNMNLRTLPSTKAVIKRFGYKIEEICFNKYFRLISNDATVLTAQEPWPKDVQLFQPYEVEQILLPDNANCLAVQTFLKMCQLDYKVEARANAEAMSPTGRVPFIKCGAFIVAELEGIVAFVGNKGISLSAQLDDESKADLRAYMTLVNNVLRNAELYLCWCDKETYNEVTKLRYGSVHPWPLNHIQTFSKRQEECRRLKVIGWHQKTIQEVYNDVEVCCQALTDRLGGNVFFFGDKYTELDALVFAHLYVLLTLPLSASLATIIKQFPNLIKFCQKIDREFFGRYSCFPVVSFEKEKKRVMFDEAFKILSSASFALESTDSEQTILSTGSTTP